MLLIFLFLICIAILIGLYFYKYLKRAFVCFGADTSKKGAKAVLIVLSVFLGLGSINIASTATLFLLHVLFLGLFLQLINFIIKRIFKGDCKIWNKIYSSGIVPVLLSLIILLTGYFNMHNVIKTEYAIYTEKDIRQEGYRVALVGDVHFGVSLDIDELKEKCNEISRQKPDIVILAGDIVDNNTSKDDMKNAFEAFGKIESKYGVFYVYGNHDRPMSFVKSEYSEAELEDAIEKSGIAILKDEACRINDELTIIGRDDLSAGRLGEGRLSLDKLIDGVDMDDYILVADHQPNDYAKNADLGANLIISGHTHGGQIWPANLIQKIFNINDAVYGHVKLNQKTEAIVTSGFAGWQYPIKTSAPAEYVLIDIKKDR